jgi:hypothetical protein
MVIQLQRWIKPPAAGQIEVSLAKGVKSGAKPASEFTNIMPASLAARLEKIRWMSPISQLLEATMPHKAGKVAKSNLPWNLLGTLFGDPGAGPLRQYLSSEIGKWLSHPYTTREHIHSILYTLEQVAGKVASYNNKPDVEEGWNNFLAQILWATLDNVQLQNLSFLWERWAEGDSQRVSLARWCGRLACHAERVAHRSKSHRLPAWAWTWSDLAKTTIQHWMIGRRKAIFCLGMWLQGYFETGNTSPPLMLGQRAFQYSLDEIISHWLTVSRNALDGLSSRYENIDEQNDFVDKLSRLTEQLRSVGTIADIATEKTFKQSQLEETWQRSEKENIPPLAKIYRYAEKAQDA